MPVFRRPSDDGLNPADVEKFTFGNLPVFAWFRQWPLSGLPFQARSLCQGAIVQSLAAALKTNSGLLEKHLARFAKPRTTPLPR